MNEPKFCKDCKHHSTSGGFQLCSVILNPVDGGPGAFADLERRGGYSLSGCGPAGRKFEPKHPGAPKPPRPKSWFHRFLGL